MNLNLKKKKIHITMGMSLSKYIHVMNTEYFTNILHSGDKIHLTWINQSQGSKQVLKD